METTLLEVQRAMTDLQIASDSMRLLSQRDAKEVITSTKAQFVSDPNAVWWWDSLVKPGLSRLFEKGDGWASIPKFTPNPESPVWFIIEDEDAPEFPVFEVSPYLAAKVVGECYAFEYYLVAKDYSWLVCENHHNVVIAVGPEAELRLATNAA